MVATVLLLRIIRERLFGYHYRVFSATPFDIAKGSPPVASGYEVEPVVSIDESLRSELLEYGVQTWFDFDVRSGNGGTVWIGRLKGEIAHIALTKRGNDVTSFFFPLSPDSVRISNCVTLPAYRRRGLYMATLRQVVRSMSEAGIRSFFLEVLDWNRPSLAAVERAGFRCIGYGILRRDQSRIWRPKREKRK